METKNQHSDVSTLAQEVNDILASNPSLPRDQIATLKRVAELLGKQDRILVNGVEIITISDKPVPIEKMASRIARRERWKERILEKMSINQDMSNQDSSNKDSKFVSTEEVAEYFGVTTQTVRDWIKKGKLSGVQQVERGRFMIPREELEFLADKREKGMQATDEILLDIFGEDSNDWDIDFEEETTE